MTGGADGYGNVPPSPGVRHAGCNYRKVERGKVNSLHRERTALATPRAMHVRA